MIRINDHISLHEDDIDLSFIRSSGPGGQNVNKLSTAAQLRFAARQSPHLSPPVLARLTKLAGQRMTNDGVIIITAERFRSQERNKQDAIDRLVALIAQAAVAPKPRRATRPTLASKRRRVEAASGRQRRAATRRQEPSRPGQEPAPGPAGRGLTPPQGFIPACC